MTNGYTIMDFSADENISGLKGYHYRRVFKGYKRDGTPKYNYKVILDGKYIKNPLNNGEFTVGGPNKISQSIPKSVLDYKAVGDKKEVNVRTTKPGNQRGTKTYYKVWNGNDYVMPGDPTLVPDRAGESPAGEGPIEEISTESSEVNDNSISYSEDTGNIFTGDLLKIDWTGNIGEGTYDEPLKIARNNSMPSTKWANTKVGEYYTFKGKKYKKGSVTAMRADRLMAAKEKVKAAARLRIENKGK